MVIQKEVNKHHQMTYEKENADYFDVLFIVYPKYDVEVNTPGIPLTIFAT